MRASTGLDTTGRSWAGRPLGTAGDDALLTTDIARRDPPRKVLERVLQKHIETFLTRCADAHGGRILLAHIERELRAASKHRDRTLSSSTRADGSQCWIGYSRFGSSRAAHASFHALPIQGQGTSRRAALRLSVGPSRKIV